MTEELMNQETVLETTNVEDETNDVIICDEQELTDEGAGIGAYLVGAAIGAVATVGAKLVYDKALKPGFKACKKAVGTAYKGFKEKRAQKKNTVIDAEVVEVKETKTK